MLLSKNVLIAFSIAVAAVATATDLTINFIKPGGQPAEVRSVQINGRNGEHFEKVDEVTGKIKLNLSSSACSTSLRLQYRMFSTQGGYAWINKVENRGPLKAYKDNQWTVVVK